MIRNKVKVSENLLKIPEDSSESLVLNDSYAEWKAAMEAAMEDLERAANEFLRDRNEGFPYEQFGPTECAEAEELDVETLESPTSGDSELATICVENHNEGLYEVHVDEDTLPRDRRDEEDPVEACDDTAHGSEEEQKDFAAIESRFRKFSNNLESTKKHVAEVNRRLKEFTRDIDDELESELDDQLEELQEFKSYLKYVFQEERFKIKCLETFLRRNGKGEILKTMSVGRPRVPKNFKEPLTYILDQLSMLCSALSVRDEILATHQTEIEVKRLYCLIKDTVMLMTIRPIIEKVVKELLRIKLRELLDIQKDNLGPTPCNAVEKDEYQPPETLASDHKKILASEETVKWKSMSQTSSEIAMGLKTRFKGRSTWHKLRYRGLGNTHWTDISPKGCVESPRGCCGCCGPGARHLLPEGHRIPHRADLLSVPGYLSVSSITKTLEMMTIRPTIENESKNYERIKFREFLDIQQGVACEAHPQLVTTCRLGWITMSRDSSIFCSQERFREGIGHKEIYNSCTENPMIWDSEVETRRPPYDLKFI